LIKEILVLEEIDTIIVENGHITSSCPRPSMPIVFAYPLIVLS